MPDLAGIQILKLLFKRGHKDIIVRRGSIDWCEAMTFFERRLWGIEIK